MLLELEMLAASTRVPAASSRPNVASSRAPAASSRPDVASSRALASSAGLVS